MHSTVSAFLTVLLLLLGPAVPVTAQDDDNPFVLAERAAAHYAAGKFGEAAATYGRVLESLPRNISVRIAYARALVKAGKVDEGLRQLETAASFGTRFDDQDEGWTAVRSDVRFRSIVAKMKARSAPLVRSETALLLEKDLIPESIAWDPATGNFYVGSMYKSKILKVTPAGQVSDFVASRRDGMWGVLGMKIQGGELWANSCNIDSPPMQVPDPATAGQAAIFRFDLGTGRLIRRYAAASGSAEKPFCFNDLVFAPNGDLYATSGMDGIHRLRKGSEAIELFLPPNGAWLNGITISPDGRTVFAASHLGGAMRVNVSDARATLIDLPPGVTLGAIDGLYFHEGSLVGVQATDPPRVVRAWLDAQHTRVTRFAVLEQGHPSYDFPLTGVVVGDDLYYIARSQLRAFEKGTIWPMERLKETVILKLPLEPAGPAVSGSP